MNKDQINPKLDPNIVPIDPGEVSKDAEEEERSKLVQQYNDGLIEEAVAIQALENLSIRYRERHRQPEGQE